jgi:hypothetical protein
VTDDGCSGGCGDCGSDSNGEREQVSPKLGHGEIGRTSLWTEGVSGSSEMGEVTEAGNVGKGIGADENADGRDNGGTFQDEVEEEED